MHLLACDLGLSLSRRASLLRRTADAFGREFKLEPRSRREFGSKFRRLRAELGRLLDGTADGPLERGREILQMRGEKIRPAAETLRALFDRGVLTVAVDEIAEALMHMHLNRLLPASRRAHELVVSDFLARLYESELSRQRS